MEILGPDKIKSSQQIQASYTPSISAILRTKVNELMSKNSEFFLKLLMNGELNEQNSSWDLLIEMFLRNPSLRYRQIGI